MRKTRKAFLSVLFSIAMLISLMPASAFASETEATAAPTVAPTAAATVAPTAAPATEWTAFLMYKADEEGWEIYEPLANNSNATTVTGDGVYTVTLKASELGTTEKAQTVKVLCVDILGFGKVLQDKGLNINNYTDGNPGDAHDISKHFQPTDLTVTADIFVDGEQIDCDMDRVNYGNIEDTKGNFRMEFYNEWGLHSACIKDNPPVDPYAICPESEIKVIFTISGTGLNTDAGAKAIADYQASKATPTVAPTPTTAAAETSASTSSSNIGIIIGIVAAVVVVVVVIIIIVTRKKK